MKFLCLAYGSEREWNALSKRRQDELLAQDEVLRRRGDVVAAVELSVTTVRAGQATTAGRSTDARGLPLAGFGIIEADSLIHAIELVANTPCSQAGGAVELREIRQ